MPEKVLKKINEKILPQWKTCFFAAFLVGLVAHLYKITNWLPNWDSLVFRYDSQNMVAIGRWFLPVVCSFTSFYDLPLLNGLVAILFSAFSAVVICKMLNVQKKVTAFFIGAVITSFPTVTSVMMYNYVADGYSIAFFLSTLAAYLMTKEKPNYLVSILLIALSAGIYQAYITVTIMLILLKLIDQILYQNAAFLEILKKGFLLLLTGLLGMLLYSAVLKAVLALFSIELLDYQGASGVSLSNLNLHASFYTIKETFLKTFFDVSAEGIVYVVLNGFVLAFSIFYYVKHIIGRKLYQKPLELFALLVLVIFLIPGAAILALINTEIDYHNLMRMGYVVFYLFFLLLYERGEEIDKKSAPAKCWIVFVVASLLVCNQIVISNTSYHKAQISYEKSYGVLIRIADRIEETPGTEDCEKIVVLGSLENSEKYSVNLTPEITGITDGYILRADDEVVGQSVLCSALNDYCGKNYSFLSGEEKQRISDLEQIKEMPAWPSQDCVTVLDEVIVIKLAVEGENK